MSIRRPRARDGSVITVARPDVVADLIRPKLRGLEQECMWVICINIRNALISVEMIGKGTVHGVECHPRDVFRAAIRQNAAGIVLCHNHPTGDPTPSQEDFELTKRLKEVGKLVGIPVVDHVVVTRDGYRSIAELMQPEGE